MEASPLFAVAVADLESASRDLDELIPVDFLAGALEGTEARPLGVPGRLRVTLTKLGREIVVRGGARARVVMPCARTTEPVEVPLDAEVHLVLSPAKAAPAAPKPRPEPARSKPGPGATQAPRRAGRGSRASEAAGGELTEGDAARDTFQGDRVVLDPFVREFLLLELPLFPLREDLRSDETPAIEAPPEAPGSPEGAPGEAPLDPRLAPLLSLRARLGRKKE